MAYGTVNADVIQSSVANTSLGAGNASIMKNRIINGAMVIDQRNSGASVTVPATTVTYGVDRWCAFNSQASKFTMQQSSVAPVGFNNSLLITSSAATTVGASDYYQLQQRIEGYNVADLNWGTANAKTVTLSFWVNCSLTGTFGGTLANSATSRVYPFSYTISSANTWQQISVTIAGDTTGTWQTTNGIGLLVNFSMGMGTSNENTAGSWYGTYYGAPTGTVNLVATNTATFYITGVQLEVGSSATGFEYVNYQTSLANCQRYYTKFITGSSAYCGFGSGIAYNSTTANITFNYPVTMRATPTASLFSVGLFYGAAALTPITSISAQYGGLTSGGLQVVATGATMTAGYAASMVSNNSTSAYMDLTAEL
jgi:hypothetical protein